MLCWLSLVSAVLDNGILMRVKSVLMAFLTAGGMLIPGNVPNMVVAGKLRITMKKWAIIVVPIGLVLMVVFFVVMFAIWHSRLRCSHDTALNLIL